MSASADVSSFHRVGMFEISVTVKPGIDPALVDKRVKEVIADYIAHGPTADEVRRAATVAAAGEVRALEKTGETSGQAGTHILLMQYKRNVPHARGGDSRSHHVAPHPQDHVGLEPIDDAQRGTQRGRDEVREGQVLPGRVAVEPADAHRGQLETGFRHDGLFRPAGAPDQEHSAIRCLSAQRARDRHRRVKVASGPAARDQNPHPILDCSPTRGLSHAGRC